MADGPGRLPRERHSVGFALVVALFTLGVFGPLGAQETAVESGGFHGHGWGTPADSVPLVAGERPRETSPGGGQTYATDLRFLGMPTRMIFYFGPDEEGLQGGMYLSRPEGLSCVGQFRTLRLMAAGERPGDSVSVQRGTGHGAPSLQEACRTFLSAESAAEWSATFRDPASGDVTARVRLVRVGGDTRIVACFGETEECRWPAGMEVDEGPVVAPAHRDTTSDQPE